MAPGVASSLSQATRTPQMLPVCGLLWAKRWACMISPHVTMHDAGAGVMYEPLHTHNLEP